MIGLCTVLGEPVDPIAAVLLQTDPMKYFMRAYDNYSRPPAAMAAAAAAAAAAAGGGGAPAPAVPAGHTAVSKLGRMLATRVIMLGAAVQMAFGRPRAASEALMRAQSEEENARAGLLLEQVGVPLRGLVHFCCHSDNEPVGSFIPMMLLELVPLHCRYSSAMPRADSVSTSTAGFPPAPLLPCPAVRLRHAVPAAAPGAQVRLPNGVGGHPVHLLRPEAHRHTRIPPGGVTASRPPPLLGGAALAFRIVTPTAAGWDGLPPSCGQGSAALARVQRGVAGDWHGQKKQGPSDVWDVIASLAYGYLTD